MEDPKNEIKKIKDENQKIPEIQSKKREMKEKEKKRKEVIYVYFIENHIEDAKVEILLDESKFASDLEIKFQDKYISNKNIFIYSIYGFKISNILSDDKIIVIIKLIDKLKKYKF